MFRRSSKDLIRDGLLRRFELAKIIAGVDELDEDTHLQFVEQTQQAADLILSVVKSGNKILIFGNGGSAAEAQHFSGDLVGRFKRNRPPIPAIALTTDTSILTAQANDCGFDTIFSRQVEALCRPDDVVIGITTSDADEAEEHSRNVLKGLQAARLKGAKSVGFFSAKTKNLLNLADVPLVVPYTSHDLIQEVHLMVVHLICEVLETSLYEVIASSS